MLGTEIKLLPMDTDNFDEVEKIANQTATDLKTIQQERRKTMLLKTNTMMLNLIEPFDDIMQDG